MAITITSRKIFDLLRPSSSVTWSLFSISEKLKIEIEFEVFTNVTFTANSKLVTGGGVQQNHIFNSSGRLSVFNVGDTIKISDGSGYFSTDQKFTVLQKISNNELVLSDCITTGNPITPGIQTSTAVINNLTPITGVAMPYNFIENAESINFNSKVNGSYQKLYCANADASSGTPIPMLFDGLTPYQTGSATIQGVSYNTTNGLQKFKIIHYTSVTPLFLASQYTDLLNDIAPSYYFSNRCLRHAYRIEAYGVYSNPNSMQGADCPLEVGNSGWFNEVFNGGAADYKIENVVYNGSSSNTKLLLNGNPQTLEFDITSSAGDWTALTNLGIGFFKLPNQQSEYINNTKTLDENFVYDFTQLDTSNTPFVPTSASTSYQTIFDVVADIVSVNTIHVTCNIQFGSDAITTFQQSQTPRFGFSVVISNPSITSASAQNKQTLFDGPKDLDTQYSVPLLDTIKKYYRHYENTGDTGVTGAITTFKNDDCVIESQLLLSPSSYPQLTKITNVINQIVGIKNDGTEFVFEHSNITIPYFVSGGIQQININLPRVFQIPSTEIRKNILITGGVIDGSKVIFTVNYPFMIRWEYWIPLLTANSDFYDTSEPNNGLNNDWFHYQNANWKVYHRITTQLEYNGVAMSFTQDTEIEINDYESNSAYTTKDVESYTLAGVSLYDSVNARWYIQSFADTIIKATFVNVGTLDINKCYVEFHIWIFENSTIASAQRYSSKWVTNNPLTMFIPLTGVAGNRIELTQPTTDTIIAKAVIDHNYLPTGNITYSLVARLYVDDETQGNKITEDGVDKITEDSIIKIIE